MILTKNSNGEWIQVAGNGKAEYGASTVRTGTIGVPAIAANADYADQTITFSTPMPDTDYLVDLSLQGSNTHRVAFHIVANTKTVNGFTVRFTPIGIKQTTEVGVSGIADNLSYMLTVQRDDTYPNLTKNTALIDPAVSLPTEWNPMQTGYLKNPMPANEATLVYTAFKLYTDTEYNSLLELPDRVETLEAYGKKVLWTGTATKGDTITPFSVQGYDEVIAQVGGTWIRLDSGHGVGANGRKKFTGLYAGRDTAEDTPYEQYYLLDILGTGYIADCAWFNVGSMNIQNARLAGQKAIECITNSAAWSDPIWKSLADVETNVNVTRIVGVKYPLIA